MNYSLIDMSNILASEISTVDTAFSLWTETFQNELEPRGLELNKEDFWNCRLLAVIKDKDAIVGSHIYNIFDLRTATPTAHNYFKDIPEDTLKACKDQGVQRIMSMEYLLVHPSYRGKNSPVRWGEVIIGLGLEVLRHSSMDAAIGIAREDKKVNTMGLKMGCQEKDFLIKNKTPCRILYMTKKDCREHENPTTQKMIKNLWNNKKNGAPNIVVDAPLINLPQAA